MLTKVKSDHTTKVEHRTCCIIATILMFILGNKVSRVRVGGLEDLREFLVHPLHKHKDVPVNLVRLVGRLGE